MSPRPHLAWFAALCDDDYEQLGVPDPSLASSFEHCSAIVHAADRAGFDAIFMPSGYALGIDTIAFTAAIARSTRHITPIVAVRMGELWVPQLARQLATLDQLLGGRMVINIISSELPGEVLPSAPRYRRTLEHMHALRTLLDGAPLAAAGEFVNVSVVAASLRTVSRRSPPLYFGGLSDDVREVAAAAADVSLARLARLDGQTNGESVFGVGLEMRRTMQKHAGVFRFDSLLKEGVQKIGEVAERATRTQIADKSMVWNVARMEALELDNLIEVARATMVSAEARKESRGAHVRDDAPDTAENPNGRDDQNWLKHTLWYSEGNRLDYKPVNLKPLSDDVEPIKRATRSY